MCVSTRSLWGCSIPLIVVAAWAAASRGEPLEYEIGGPLAGVKLPPYPTQHGEPLGQPGVLLDTNDEGQPIRPVANEPEWHLYDGAVEHFVEDGDIEFVQEAARLLRPGGRLFLSFGIGPYREWRWEWLFCRTYDDQALWERLIAPSGLEVEATMYFEAGLTRRFSERWFKLPLIVRNGLLGWLQQPIFKWLYRRENASARNANYFGIVLCKPPAV